MKSDAASIFRLFFRIDIYDTIHLMKKSVSYITLCRRNEYDITDTYIVISFYLDGTHTVDD